MTKKTVLGVLFFFLLITATGFCYDQSFRSVATGNLLYGDFDNDLDPIYIWDNNGYRVYTTLSNLSSHHDRFFSDINNDVYLFGTSGNFSLPELGGWASRSMFVVELSDSRNDLNSGLDTDYDGSIDLNGTGYMSGDRVLLYDTNGDNIFDTRANYTSTADNYSIMKNRDWTLVHSYSLDKTIIGVSFSHVGYGNNLTESNNHSNLFHCSTPTHNFSYSNKLIQSNLSGSEVYDSRYETGDFLTTHEEPANIFNMALETPLYLIPNSEFRLEFTYENRKNQYNVIDSFTDFRDVSAGGVIDITEKNELVEVDSSLSGSIYTPAARLTKHWNKNTYSWFDISFGFGSFDANKTFSDRYDSEIQEPLAGNNSITTYDYDNLVEQSGDTKHGNFRIAHKTVVDFSENFTFAAGVNFNYISNKTDWEADFSTDSTVAFVNGDSVSDDNDFIYTQTSSWSGNLINNAKITTITLPVAMEYKMKRWTFRFGAQHTINRTTTDLSRKVTSSSPTTTTITYGDSTVVTTISDDDFVSWGNATERQQSHTDFVYGLGFKANNNLNIELLYYLNAGDTDFLNTDFYQSLRLSLTLLFQRRNKMKKILILMTIAGLMLIAIFSCNKRETNPIETDPDISDFNPGVNQAGFFDIVTEPTGGPLSLPEGMAVIDSDAPEAQIGCEFATRLDSATIDSAFSLVNSDGAEVALEFEFNFGPHTVVYIRPTANLAYNTTYILSISAALLKNEAGDMLDVDGDNVGGETPDDNLSYRFTTHFQGDSFNDIDNDGIYDGQVDSNGDHIWEDVNSEGETIGETFTDEFPYNNTWDNGESYIDDNGNDSYDAGERYTDINPDSVFNAEAEDFEDDNQNGYADLGEFFNDADGDSTWDDAESYTDLNFNGDWDNTELRYDHNGNGVYNVGDGDTYVDIETVNGVCDYAEPFTNANGNSGPGPASDSMGTYYDVPIWDDAEDVLGGYDYNSNGEYDAGTFLVPDSAEAWNPSSVNTKSVFIDGNWYTIPFCGFAEDFTDANSDLVWNPADEFIDIISNGVWDAAPEDLTVDVNSDGMYDTAYAGIQVPQTVDDLPPVITRNLYYLIDNNEVNTRWVDVSIAIDVADSAFDNAGGRIEQALPSSAFDAANVILRDDFTKASVECAISYDNVATSATYLRLLINPTGNLAAGKIYELLLKAQLITDAEGNKLNNTQDVSFTFSTTNSTSDGTVIIDDITPPEVDDFVDGGGTFTVEFSEEIDVSTISAATIEVTDNNGNHKVGRFVIGTMENSSSPTGLATTVTFYPNNPNWTNGTVKVKSPIKDLAGNIKGSDSLYSWNP